MSVCVLICVALTTEEGFYGETFVMVVMLSYDNLSGPEGLG